MAKPSRRLLAFAAICLIDAALPAQCAQPTTGILTGVVLNTKGAPVPAAQVFWQASDGTSPHELHTDLKGHFRITGLTPGLYELRAEAGGTWSEWDHNMLVRVGVEKRVTLRLVRKTSPALAAGAPKGQAANAAGTNPK